MPAKERAAKPESPPARPRTFVMSEGVREELYRTGRATDPGTGDALVLDESGAVTVTDRTGGVTTLDVAALNPVK